ncbi:hypothetical protein QR680_003730 [Steinernema hermaphroditum]|uniref:G-protein coupled receptors family 1 profile domain-containing protein n=1 Tax=Steinernema hermaphroditum TaxID=289476 RepID=A0AA39HNL4_9BILA|nr:hypothetical protein QR680_003730 [Steinernema hermaphroditum]
MSLEIQQQSPQSLIINKPTMPPTINLIMGPVYLFISGFSLIINITVLSLMTGDPKYRSGSYRIIKNICVSCIIQLVPYFIGGFMTLTDNTFNYYLDRIIGATVESGWFLYISLFLTLAVDRLLVFVRIVSPTNAHKVTWTMLICCWIFWLCAFIILLIPCFGYTYNGVTGHFVWIHIECELAYGMMDTEMYLDFVFFFIDLIIYVIVFVYLIKRKFVLTQTSSSYFVEIRILIVALISFFYESIFIIWCFWIPGFLPNPRDMDIIASCLWMGDSGLFATVTLLINASLRDKLKGCFFKTKVTTVEVTQSTSRITGHTIQRT